MPRSEPVPVQPLPDLDELRAWVAPNGGPRVTVYLPIQRSVPEFRQNAVLLEQAVREVGERLAARPDADAVRPHAERLARLDIDLARLPAGTRAVAVLIDARGLHAAALPIETPYAVTVAEHFVLRPLLGALQRRTRYRVLAISAKRVAHFEGEGTELREVPLPGVPKSLADALGEQVTGKPLPTRGSGGEVASHYAYGSPSEERKLDMVRFHEALGRSLRAALGDDKLPIVLAATEEQQAGVRAAVKLPGLLDEGITGNFDHASAAELAARAAPVVERWLARRAEETTAAWERARNRGKAVDLLADVATAALASRVQRLWVDATRSLPGRLDPAVGQPVDGDGDVLEALCEHVLARGGEVIPVDGALLPSGTGAAAELR